MTRIRCPELLAPAGDMEKLKWAIKYGADAVYFGGKDYGMRANSKNFSLTEIKEAVRYAHRFKKKVYITVNIVFHHQDMKDLKNYLKALGECLIDAIIITDPFLIPLAKKIIPKVDIFLSTQQSTLNYQAALFWQKEGIKRIILGREASSLDIKEIIDKTNLEVEVFIQGAMCVGYSGNCHLSNYFTMRDANRGGCSQVCRWFFNLQTKDGKSLSKKTPFSIAPKDLSLLKHMPKLIDMGVTSFKIEGRMRSLYYIATTVNIYRRVIDEYCLNPATYKYNNNLESELYRCANRDCVPQYFKTKPGVNEQYFISQEETSNQDFLGIVIDYNQIKKEVIIEQRNFFKVGDEVDIFGPHRKITFKIDAIYDIQGKPLTAARHPKQIIKIPLFKRVYKKDLMRIKIDKTAVDNHADL